MSPKYIRALQDVYTRNADATLAPGMKKYMRDKFEYLGIRTPVRRQLDKQFHREHEVPALADVSKLIRSLYRLPEREYHYFAVELFSRTTKSWTPGVLSDLEFLITHNSWWDTVDAVAYWVGEYFLMFPNDRWDKTDEWAKSENIWLQRMSIIFQLAYKKKTDSVLLFRNIMTLRHENEFFIRKAIGWALRQYGKTEPDSVLQFVRSTTLKPLSQYEALRIIVTK